MTESATKPLRTWRPMAAWTAGILVVLGLMAGLPSAGCFVPESGDTQANLQRMEHSLLDSSGKWADTYRALVALGQPGWEAICKAEFHIAPSTEHLRCGEIDIGTVPTTQQDAFYRYHKDQLDKLLEDEKWTMAYAKSLCANSRTHQDGLTNLASSLKADYQQPKDARLTIAILRVVCKTDVGFPWHGTAKDQQASIDRWLTYLSKEFSVEDVPPPRPVDGSEAKKEGYDGTEKGLKGEAK